MIPEPLKLGLHRVGAAACIVRIPTSLPAHMRDGVREIVRLWVPTKHREKGYATSLMHAICRDADLAGVTLMLQAAPFEGSTPGETAGMTRDALEAWYQAMFGFQLIQAEPRLFARQVGATPKQHLRLTPVVRAILEKVRQ